LKNNTMGGSRMFCPACGKQISEKARFCHLCGADTTKYNDATGEQQESTAATDIPAELSIDYTPSISPPVINKIEDAQVSILPVEPLRKQTQVDIIHAKNMAIYPSVEPIASTPGGRACSHCGFEMADDVKFCKGCGHKVDVEPAVLQKPVIIPVQKPIADKPKVPKLKKSKKKGILILTPLLLIAATVAFVLLWNGGLYWNIILNTIMPLEQYGYPPPGYTSNDIGNPSNNTPDDSSPGTTMPMQPGTTIPTQPSTTTSTPPGATEQPPTTTTTPPGQSPEPNVEPLSFLNDAQKQMVADIVAALKAIDYQAAYDIQRRPDFLAIYDLLPNPNGGDREKWYGYRPDETTWVIILSMLHEGVMAYSVDVWVGADGNGLYSKCIYGGPWESFNLQTTNYSGGKANGPFAYHMISYSIGATEFEFVRGNLRDGVADAKLIIESYGETFEFEDDGGNSWWPDWPEW
jgi:RNA polymerase subunit RPABC4/transcription elongation factor Spt4